MNGGAPGHGVTVGTPFAARTAHLDLDLAGADRPGVVSSVLHSCLQTGDGQALSWQQVHAADLVRRLGWLLELGRLSGVQSLDLHCRCPACDAEIALSLDPGSFEQPSAAGEFDCEPEARVRLRLRLPTGEDQSRWAHTGVDDFARLAADLVLAVSGDADRENEGAIRRDWLPAIEAALETVDPLTALQIQTACPDCGHAFGLPIDLEQLLLQRLMAEQVRVLRDIHRIATRYHWRERDILALSPVRRAFYLRCIDQERVQ